MTNRPALSWHPTTIEELQRLLDSGVWPRIRAIADDVGPLQIAQGRLTYIDKKGGMSGILREGPAPAGAEPFDLTSRSLWLWRAEASASSTPKHEHTLVLRLNESPRFETPEQSAPEPRNGSALAVERLRAFDEALDKLERRAGHVSWQDFAAALQRWGTAASTMARSDVASALGSLADNWAPTGADQIGTDREIAGAAEQLVRRLDQRIATAAEQVRAAGVDLCVVELDGGGWRMEASCDDPEGPLGPECIVRGEDRDSKAEAVVDAWEYVAIRLLAQAGEDRHRLTAVLAGRDEQQQLMGEVEDGLRKIARASGMIVDVYQPAHVYVSALVERVEKQLALRSPVLRTDDEQVDRAALDRLTTYMRINHAHSLNSGEHVADVATWALAGYAKDHGLLCEQLGLLPVTSSSGVRAAIKGMAKDFRKVADQLGTDREIAGAAEQLVRRLVDHLINIDDARERLAKWCPECDPGKTSLLTVVALLEADVLKLSADAFEALDRIASASGAGAIVASDLAERVEQQFAETDPEYIEQLRRGGS